MLAEDVKSDAKLFGNISPDHLHVSTNQSSLLDLVRRCPILRELQREISTDSPDISYVGKEDLGFKIRRKLRKVSGSRDLVGEISK